MMRAVRSIDASRRDVRTHSPNSSIAVRRRRDLLGILVLAATSIVAGLVITKSFYLTMLIYSAIFAIAALGMFLLFGFAGQISIGQAAFFGVGAYTSAYSVMQLGFHPAVGMMCATLLSGCFGWLVSRPLLRLTTNYLAMGTLAFGVICFILFAQFRSITGGLDPGVLGLPPFHIGSWILDEPRKMYWLVAGILCVVMLLVVNIVHSRIGRALRALKVSDVAAAGVGVDVVRYKVATFTLAAALTGLAGSLFAHFQSAFNASVFNVGLSIELLIMVVVGSVATPWGALFGALIVTILPSLLEDFERYKLLAYGGVLTLVMIYMPDGLGKAILDGAKTALKRARAS
jgi:branched-chain amino acid transport system permease protein